MGNWTLERLSVRHSDLITPANFGHNVHAFFRMTYKPTTFGGFTEMPMLQWNEQITYMNIRDGEWWQQEVNFFATKPTSATLVIWAKRYIEAYNRAAGQPDALLKGRSELLDKNGMAVKIAALGAGKATNKDKSDAVRNYLKSHGGTLAIEIHDVPSIALPLTPNEHAERFLFFDIGVGVGGMRVQAAQHLVVQDGLPQANWTRNFTLGGHPGNWGTRGMRKIPVPPLQAMMNTQLGSGEYM